MNQLNQETINKLWIRAMWMNHKTKASVQILHPEQETVIYLRYYVQGALKMEKRYFQEQIETALQEGANLAEGLGCRQRIGQRAPEEAKHAQR
jgi:hypothetical protein